MKHMLNRGIAATALMICILLVAPYARGEVADLANVPLGVGSSTAVQPNMMVMFPNDGNTFYDFSPPQLINPVCKQCSGGSCNATATCYSSSFAPTLYHYWIDSVPNINKGAFGRAPWFAHEYNTMFYSPDFTYSPAVNANGVSMVNQNIANAQDDPYNQLWPGTTTNLLTQFPDPYYCAGTTCVRNGINNVQAAPNDYFLYWSNGYPDASYSKESINTTASGSAYYYTISPHEYCSDANLINCALATASGAAPAGYSYPAPVRYCKAVADVMATTAISDAATTTTPRCRRNYAPSNAENYMYPRFGRFRRVNIISSTTQYSLRPTAVRPDCANAAKGYCTYAEESTNFANWFSYYRLRLNMFKTATGRAFQVLGNNVRAGIIPTYPYDAISGAFLSGQYVPVNTFTGTQKTNFYNALYSVSLPTVGITIPPPNMRQGLARIGRYYAGIQSGINVNMGSVDPVQFSCQKNNALLLAAGPYTDPDTAAIGLTNSQVGDQDDIQDAADPFFVARKNGTYDGVGTQTTTVTSTVIDEQVFCSGKAKTTFATLGGAGSSSQISCGCTVGTNAIMALKYTVTNTLVAVDGVGSATGSANTATSYVKACNFAVKPADITLSPNPLTTTATPIVTTVAGGTPNTLADVAMYYYKNDLRTTGPLATNNVPTNSKDITPQQHMVTFAVGIGSGSLQYISNYESSVTGDFANIKNGASNCSWNLGATCNWPKVIAYSQAYPNNSFVDDIWHAAVNGRGTYYAASDPNTLTDGIANVLLALNDQAGAASASATSNPNVTQTDNYIYSSTFTTGTWTGDILAQQIDPASGNVLPTIKWSAQTQLDAQVSASSDMRTIYTLKTGALVPFTWASLGSDQSFFSGKCSAFSQCNLLTVSQIPTANDGASLVNYLRGQTQYAGTVFRARDHALGDAVNAVPVFVRAPKYGFNDAVMPNYASFVNANSTRQSVLYVAANDGMLHAFNGDTGQELWAYVPHMIFPLLPALASESWSANHRFLVDGSPTVMDVFDPVASAWKTILVAGLGNGGRGYYALDITDPNNPKGLWEACSDSSLCAVSDNDFGFSFGSPVITKLPTNGQWVALVTSGMNNLAPGTGHGFVFALDALTGAIVKKIDTGAGDTTTPSGFAKISGFANNYTVDNTTLYVYGGDLLGNVWSINLSAATSAVLLTAATPAVLNLAQLKDATGKPQSVTTRPELSIVSGFRVVYVGTGRYLGGSDIADPSTLTPAEQWAYQQSLYAIKDRGVALGNIRTATPGLVKQTLSNTSLTTRTTSSNAVDWTTKDGWFVDFNPGNDSPGERVNVDPQLAKGTLVVATAVPTNSVTCAAGGDSWLYQFDYRAGTFVASASGSIAAQKNTGSILVGIAVISLPNGAIKGVTTSSAGTKNTVGINTVGSGGNIKRISWREMIQ
jgi:Tfp pilus tip-associated adhesin PilY1